MVEIKVLGAKFTAAGHSSGVQRNPCMPLKHGHEQQDFLKRRSGSLKHGAEIDLLTLRLEDFNVLVASLKNSNNTALRLYNRSLGNDGELAPVQLRPSDPTSYVALERFSRALARGVGAGGWLQELELGFCPSRQDIKGLSQAISCSSSLQNLSLANSALGDEGIQLLARGLCECRPLQVLDLSGCALTDTSVTSVASIIKVGVRRTADTEWRLSLREPGGSRLKQRASRLTGSEGLAALNLSFNMFSDAASRQLCDVLRLGAPLEALNLQGNQLRRKSAHMYLLVFQTWGLPRLVDLRKNLDGMDVGVLEDGRHLRSFSSGHSPFWKASLPRFPSENMSRQERNPTSQKQKPGPSGNLPPKPLRLKNPAPSNDVSSGPLQTKNLCSTAEDHSIEYPDHEALLGWSSSTHPIAQKDSSSQGRKSASRKECLPGPNGDDQRAEEVSITSLPYEDCVDQISLFSGTNEGGQISSSRILDVRKQFPGLWEAEIRGSKIDHVEAGLSPLQLGEQPSNQLEGKIGEDPSRPLSPILDPATPEVTVRKHPNRATHDSTELPSRSCQRDQRVADDGNPSCAPTLDDRRSPNSTGGSHPGEQKMRKSSGIHVKQSTSKDNQKGGNRKLRQKIPDPKLAPSKEFEHRQNMRKQMRGSKQYPVQSTSEWQKEELDWNGFIWEMAKSLMHLQERLDVLLEPSQPTAEIADKVSLTSNVGNN